MLGKKRPFMIFVKHKEKPKITENTGNKLSAAWVFQIQQWVVQRKMNQSWTTTNFATHVTTWWLVENKSRRSGVLYAIDC